MKFIRDAELKREELVYPSPWNPRLKGINPNEPSIKSLADSIKHNGQLQRIIVHRNTENKYETIDGDRRCVAIFDVLKWSSIKASIYELSHEEAARWRLISNIQRQDLSTIEKGKYCFDLFNLVAKMEHLDSNLSWSDRETRSKILAKISEEVNVSPVTIINWVRLWQNIPPKVQKLIAADKEDLRRGLIPPSLALDIYSLSKSTGISIEKLFDVIVKNSYGCNDIRYVRRQIRAGATIDSIEDVAKLIEEYRGKVRVACRLERTDYSKLYDISKKHKVSIEQIYDLAMRFACIHINELTEFILDKTVKGEP